MHSPRHWCEFGPGVRPPGLPRIDRAWRAPGKRGIELLAQPFEHGSVRGDWLYRDPDRMGWS